MCQDRYRFKCIHNHRGEKEWLIYDSKKPKEYHTHLTFDKKTAAKMICIRASQGKIPESYPHWMIISINRLWYGKDFENRQDLNNENLLIKDEDIRIKRKIKKIYPRKRQMCYS